MTLRLAIAAHLKGAASCHQLTRHGPCGISFDLRTPQQGAVTAMPIRASDRSPDDGYRIHARRLFPGQGAAPLSDQVIEIRDGVITAIAGMDRAEAGAVGVHVEGEQQERARHHRRRLVHLRGVEPACTRNPVLWRRTPRRPG